MFSFLRKILFPIVCISCNADDGEWLCNRCKSTLKEHIQKESYKDISFDIYTLFKSNPMIRKVIHGMKYKFYKESSKLFQKYIYSFLQTIQKPYIIVPVPLHKKKYRNRGFNQVISLIPEGEMVLHILRIKNTKSQMSLEKKERIINIENAFVCKQTLDSLYTYVILDDVVTTGSTIKR